MELIDSPQNYLTRRSVSKFWIFANLIFWLHTVLVCVDSLTVLSIHLHKKKFSTIFLLLTIDLTWTGPIEERWRKKPRQTDVVVFWGKITTHMLLFRLCSRRVDKRWAGSKMWGDICILHFFNIDQLILASTAILLYGVYCVCVHSTDSTFLKQLKWFALQDFLALDQSPA